MQLDVAKVRVVGGEREDSERERDELYLSVKQLGLLQPIVVVEDPDTADAYRVIAGRRRLDAVKRLEWQYIDATIRTFSEAEAEMAELAENLHRVDLEPARRDRSISRFHQLYEALHPELIEQKKEVEEARQANIGQAAEPEPPAAEANGAVVTKAKPGRKKGGKNRPKEEREAAKTKKPTGTKATAEQFGVSETTVKAAIKRADALTELQRQALDAAKVPLERITRIAKIPDPAEREAVVNLLAAQMDYAAAMKEVLGDRFEGVEEDAELSDEDFLASLPLRNKVDKAKFEADALLYRGIQKAKIAFGRSIAWGDLKKKVANNGIYFRRLLLWLEAKHPREWLLCHQCTRGQTQNGECKQCRGGGYQIG